MKKIYILLMLLILILTACGTTSTTTNQAVSVQEATAAAPKISNSETSSVLSTEYANALPIPMQLMIGILQLDGSDLAITSAQASSLLPVLTSAKDLSSNNSATEEQISSLTEQVQSILSDEQIQAIAKMQITQETSMNLLRTRGNGNPPAQGNVPQGTPLAGAPNGQPPSENQIATPPGDGSQFTMSFVPPPLIDTLIQLMQSRASGL